MMSGLHTRHRLRYRIAKIGLLLAGQPRQLDPLDARLWCRGDFRIGRRDKRNLYLAGLNGSVLMDVACNRIKHVRPRLEREGHCARMLLHFVERQNVSCQFYWRLAALGRNGDKIDREAPTCGLEIVQLDSHHHRAQRARDRQRAENIARLDGLLVPTKAIEPACKLWRISKRVKSKALPVANQVGVRHLNNCNPAHYT
jgi:hypothetical protein